MSVKSSNFGLKVLFPHYLCSFIQSLLHFQSYSEDLKAHYFERAMNTYNLIEGTLVNGDVPLKFSKTKVVEPKSKES